MESRNNRAMTFSQRVAQLRELAGYAGYAASAPVPAQLDGHATDRVFFYSAARAPKRGRPIAWMELDAQSGAVLRLSNCHVEDFVDTREHPLDAELDYALSAPGGAREQMERIRRLEALYPQVRAAAFNQQLSAGQREAVQEYVRLIEEAAPAALMPYYRALGEEFLHWAETLR